MHMYDVHVHLLVW